jgi:hypothetical protein
VPAASNPLCSTAPLSFVLKLLKDLLSLGTSHEAATSPVLQPCTCWSVRLWLLKEFNNNNNDNKNDKKKVLCAGEVCIIQSNSGAAQWDP